MVINTEQKDREGTITVKDKNSDKKQVVTIKQSRIDLEREALIALYKATNGDNWTNNTNWCSDKPVSEWYGITALTNPTRILAIDLATNNLSGTLPDEIGNLPNLNSLHLPYNNLKGGIPNSICELVSLEELNLAYNSLTGKIPENIGNLRQLQSLVIYNNKLEGNLPQSIGDLTELTLLNIQHNNLEGTLPESIENLKNLIEIGVLGNKLSGYIPKKVLSHPNWKIWCPEERILNQQSGHGLSVRIEDLYTSTDYSMDGEITILQTHIKGNGIKIVVMGDQFVDTDMVPGGFYEIKAKEAVEYYFSIEPFRSLRELFDIILIKTVSKNNQMSGETAFSTKMKFDQWGVMSYHDMDTEKCREYIQRILNINNLENISVVMLQNLYTDNSFAIQRYDGFSIGNCPLGFYHDDNIFAGLVHHEANGHGFGFFSDEYLTGANLEITEEDKKSIDKDHEKGFLCNIDYISDSDEILWSKFIKDSRYDSERIGIYEGAGSSSKGIYRATENSVMRVSYLGLFNAPMREAIYKRAMKLAYGDSWTYDYEEFVKFDEPGRAEWINTYAKSVNKKTMKDYKHIPPKIFNYPAVVK